MNICLVNSLYDPHTRGGAEDIVKILAEYLSSQGHNISIITSDTKHYTKPHIVKEQNGKIAIFRIGGYNIIPFYDLAKLGPFLRFIWHFNDVFARKSKPLFKQIIEDLNPDLIWMHNLKGIGYGVIGVAKKSSAKTLLTLHDIQYFDPSGLIIYNSRPSPFYRLFRKIYGKFVKMAMQNPDLLISPSQWIVDFYQKKNFFTGTDVLVLPNPLDNINTQIIKKKNSHAKILFAGQIEKHKGVMVLIKAVNQYNASNKRKIQLDIYGRGSLVPSITDSKYIHLRNWVKFAKLINTISSYDLLVVPSLCYENSPTIIRLAKLAGVPVLGSNIGGIPELLDTDVGDYLFIPNNVQSLMQELERWHNRKLSHRLRPVKQENIMTISDYWESVSAKV